MKLNKSDFIEIDFTGKFKDSGEVFDSTIASELKKLSPHAVAKSFTFALGQEMFLPGISNFLIGKEVEKFPKNFTIELKPKDAFGPRNAEEVKMVPMKIFKEHNVQPIPGASLNFDGRIARILSVSGGRVLVDFNNPLAGKEVVYEVKVLSKVDDVNQKIKSLNEFLFKKDFHFKVSGKKVILEVDKGMKPLVEMFKDKFKDILGMDLEVNELGEKSASEKGEKIEVKKEKKENVEKKEEKPVKKENKSEDSDKKSQ